MCKYCEEINNIKKDNDKGMEEVNEELKGLTQEAMEYKLFSITKVEIYIFGKVTNEGNYKKIPLNNCPNCGSKVE